MKSLNKLEKSLEEYMKTSKKVNEESEKVRKS